MDLFMYARAVPLLLRHPAVFVMPLLAAVVELLVNQLSNLVTDPVGGLGSSIFGMLVQLIYLWAFGVTIIQANNIWRRGRGTFDEAWEEGRLKFGAIALAAIGFQFVVWAASYIGSFFGAGMIGLALGALAAFFLIYTIPAAAIGGIPGTLALSVSIRNVRAQPLGSLILALVFFLIWYVAVPLGLPSLLVHVSPSIWSLITAAVRAVALAYLAFPFAKQYDDIAFSGYW
ncbi:MAG: hypothetical protein JO078_12735 [Candidatus Eremiobacteraeota bacterium]|nr:hypothetical protein [Candidatus Eremiobacteraeota bacterium]MBV9700967.1 hypothetical protein [Candidatus Eremiobacteraeota bacterium]